MFLACEEGPIAEHIRARGPRITNVHVEDMVRGVHERLMFGEGTMDFPPILGAPGEAGYRGGLHVERSRHSHVAVAEVRRSFAFLTPSRGRL
jgi:L-ribulose-5-phosphate 3-epimerase